MVSEASWLSAAQISLVNNYFELISEYMAMVESFKMTELNCSGSNPYRTFMVYKDGHSTVLNMFVNRCC